MRSRRSGRGYRKAGGWNGGEVIVGVIGNRIRRRGVMGGVRIVTLGVRERRSEWSLRCLV